MAKHVEEGSSIECNKSQVAVRKLTLVNNTMVKFDGTPRLFKYKSGIRGNVMILEELNPLEAIVCESSFLKLHDELEAEIIEIYAEKRIKLDVESNYSHVHGIQKGDVKGFTYAKIMTPFRQFLEKGRLAIGQ